MNKNFDMSDQDVMSFLQNAFGMTYDDNDEQNYKESYFMDKPCHKIISCLYNYEETNDRKELLKARFYLNRLIGEQNGG